MNGRQVSSQPDHVPGPAIPVDIVSERFLSRKGSGQVRGQIPGAHEALSRTCFFFFFIDGSSTALKNGLVDWWLWWGVLRVPNWVGTCYAKDVRGVTRTRTREPAARNETQLPI